MSLWCDFFVSCSRVLWVIGTIPNKMIKIYIFYMWCNILVGKYQVPHTELYVKSIWCLYLTAWHCSCPSPSASPFQQLSTRQTNLTNLLYGLRLEFWHHWNYSFDLTNSLACWTGICAVSVPIMTRCEFASFVIVQKKSFLCRMHRNRTQKPYI